MKPRVTKAEVPELPLGVSQNEGIAVRWSEVLAGDQAAISALFERIGTEAKRYLTNKFPRLHDPDDLIDSVRRTIFRRIAADPNSIRPENDFHFRNVVCVYAFHRALNRKRKKRPDEMPQMKDELGNCYDVDVAAEPAMSSIDRLINHEMVEALKSVIYNGTSNENRRELDEAILQGWLEDLSLDEIRERLKNKITIDAIRMRRMRLREALRKAIESNEDEK